MGALTDPWLFWLIVIVQCVGVGAIPVARVGHRVQAYLLCQCIYLASLLVVCAVLVLSFSMGSHGWVWCGITVSIMIVGATLDTGSRRTEVGIRI